MSGSSAEWDELIAGLRAGDEATAREVYERFAVQLENLAERQLPAGIARRVGADEVVQSVYRTFFRRAREGQFDLPNSGALWRLLTAVTLTKIREQARFHLRQKRGVNREQSTDLASPDDSIGSLEPVSEEPTPSQNAAFAEQFALLIEALDDQQRRIVDFKLQECTNEEIAARLGCSERTVRRQMKNVQGQLTGLLDAR